MGGWWQFAAVGGSWRLAVGGPLGRSLRAVLNKKKSSPLRTALTLRHQAVLRMERIWPKVPFYSAVPSWIQDLSCASLQTPLCRSATGALCAQDAPCHSATGARPAHDMTRSRSGEGAPRARRAAEGPTPGLPDMKGTGGWRTGLDADRVFLKGGGVQMGGGGCGGDPPPLQETLESFGLN